MSFEVRDRDFIFKHTCSEKPDISEERFKEHFHTTYELLFFVHGDADYMVEHRRYRIRPGSLLIAKPGEYHNIVFRSDAPYERYVLRFSQRVVDPGVWRQLEQINTVYFIEGSLLARAFLRAEEHVAAVQRDLHAALCFGMLNVILSHLISAQDLIRHADYVNEEARAIVKYIERHLPEIRSSEEIARALHMSKSALYKSFTQQFQIPLMTYVRTQKCMLAREIISEGITATAAAERLGFQHYSSFYRDYIRVFGEPPSGKPAG